MQPRIFSITGYSNTGKTTLTCAVIQRLTQLGYTVGTIKSMRSPHPDAGFKYKKQNDAQRHLDAGAIQTATWSQAESALIFQPALDLQTMIQYYETDFVLIEGGKGLQVPRIITGRTTDDLEAVWRDHVFAIGGLIAEELDDFHGVATYQTANDVDSLVDLIIEQARSLAQLSTDKE